MKISETDLILQAQRGDMGAFETLVRQYDRKVLALALRYTQDPDSAMDIYQEAFLKVFRGLKGFRFESQFSTWLYRLVTNVCLSHVSNDRKGRLTSLDAVSDEGFRTPNPSRRGSVPSGMIAPGTSADLTYSREVSERIESALAALSRQQRMVFILRHFEGLKLREIAEFLDCAEGTVKNHLFHATERLRAHLQEVNS